MQTLFKFLSYADIYRGADKSLARPTSWCISFDASLDINSTTRVVPKVMSNFFLQANWEQQTKESMVVDGTSCCVILEFLWRQ